jgi:hypothetical protein
MLSMDDTRWSGLKGGHRTLFDPRPLLKRLDGERDTAAVWQELWNELHHQGDVGEASFAAAPHIVRIYRNRKTLDWNAYAIVAVIELARNKDGNPDVPEWLKEQYFGAISELAERGISELPLARDPDTCRAILSIVALAKNLRNHAYLLIQYSEDELEQMEFCWRE